MCTDEVMQKKLMMAGKVIVTFGLVFWLIERVDWGGVWTELAGVSWWLLMLYVFLQLAGNLISARKWQIIAEYRNIYFTLREGFFTYMTGAFINNFLPSTIGGDAYRGLWLAKRSGGRAAGLSTVVFDRFIGLWTTALLGREGARPETPARPRSPAKFRQRWPISGLLTNRATRSSAVRTSRLRKHAHRGALHFLERRFGREQAGVAGRLGVARVVDRHLAVEADRRARHQWFSMRHTSGVDGVAGGEVVAAIDHHIGVAYQ